MESRSVGRVWDQALRPLPCPVCLYFGVVSQTNTLNFCLKKGEGVYSLVFCTGHLEKPLEFCLVICGISLALV